MSGGLSTPNARPPQSKSMSSRLLNMKFMQRAAVSQPSTPSSEPALKRRKTNDTSAASSPSVSSTPGTPYGSEIKNVQPPLTTLPEILRRVGTSNFTRAEGADTEWVLDVKITPRQQAKPKPLDITNDNGKSNGFSGIPGLGEVESDQDDEDEESEEDIWHDQPAGRQTYGAFKRKGTDDNKEKPKKTKPPKAKKVRIDEFGQYDEPPSSESSSSATDNSESDSDSDSDPSASADDEDEENEKNTYARQRRQKQKQQQRDSGGIGVKTKKSSRKSTAAEDSDEEMRRVRLEMEQKHDRMAGLGNGRGGHGGGGNGLKRPRRADDHHVYNTDYKDRARAKKPRKTI